MTSQHALTVMRQRLCSLTKEGGTRMGGTLAGRGLACTCASVRHLCCAQGIKDISVAVKRQERKLPSVVHSYIITQLLRAGHQAVLCGGGARGVEV